MLFQSGVLRRPVKTEDGYSRTDEDMKIAGESLSPAFFYFRCKIKNSISYNENGK
jgi:hypothetical protein